MEQTLTGLIIIAIIIMIAYKAGASTSEQSPVLLWEIIINQIKIKGGIMSVNAKPNQFATGTVSPKDRLGNPAGVEAGTVEYTSDNPEVCTVEEDPDTETKFKLNFHAVGFANVTVKADADLGEGVATIEGTLQVVVEPEQAVGFGVEVGEAQDN